MGRADRHPRRDLQAQLLVGRLAIEHHFDGRCPRCAACQWPKVNILLDDLLARAAALPELRTETLHTHVEPRDHLAVICDARRRSHTHAFPGIQTRPRDNNGNPVSGSTNNRQPQIKQRQWRIPRRSGSSRLAIAVAESALVQRFDCSERVNRRPDRGAEAQRHAARADYRNDTRSAKLHSVEVASLGSADAGEEC
jgi:hypothetical protein